VGVVATRPGEKTTSPPPPAPSPPPAPPPATLTGPKVTLDAGPGWKRTATWGKTDWKHAGGIFQLAVSPDGKLVASASIDGSAKVWDFATGRELASFADPERAPMRAVGFSPKGDRVLIGGYSRKAWILDARTGEHVQVIDEREGSIVSVDWDRGGERVLTAAQISGDGTRDSVRVIDLKTGQVFPEFRPVNGQISTARFLDKDRVVTTGNDGAVIVFDVGSGRELSRQKGPGRINDMAVFPGGRRVLTGNNDTRIAVLWDLERGTKQELEPHLEFEQFAVAVSPDGDRAYVGHREEAQLWGGLGGDAPRVVATRAQAPVWHGVAFTPKGDRIVSGHWDGSIQMRDAATLDDASPPRAGLDGPVSALRCWNGVVTVLGRGDDDRAVTVVETKPGATPRTFPVKRFIGGTTLSRDGALLVAAHNHHYAERVPHERRLYDARTGELRNEVQDLQSEVDATAITSNKRIAIFGDRAGVVRAFSVDDWNDMGAAKNCRGKEIKCLAFLDDNVRWVAGTLLGQVVLGDVNPGIDAGFSPELGVHQKTVTAVAVLRDKLALTGDEGGVAKLWDIAQRAQLGANLTHTRAIRDVAFAPSGKLIATASEDGTVALWTVAEQKRVATIDLWAASTDWPTALVFENDRVLHVGTARGVVHTFSIDEPR
jgi:WD40 repeat protein